MTNFGAAVVYASGVRTAIAMIALLFAEACPPASTCKPVNPPPAPNRVDPLAAPELTVAGDMGSTEGIFDPSPVYLVGADAGAMAYSSVPAQNAIFTRTAISTDRGATWQWAADANASVPLTVSSTASECPAGSCTGKLVHEVPSLVFDADDPDAQRRWKIFTASYLVLGADQLLYDHGVISLFTAPAPEGPWSAGEHLLGWNSRTPFSSTGVTQNLSGIPELAGCVVFTEPGALVLPGRIDLALGCVSVDGGAKIRIVLLRSVDHAKSFSYVSTLLRSEDAACGGSSVPQLNAAHLFVAGGQPYVVASPAGTVPPGFTGYRGCDVYRIDDLTAGHVERDARGAPVIHRRIGTTDDRFSGACAAAEGATSLGYVMPALFVGETRRFRILKTGLPPP